MAATSARAAKLKNADTAGISDVILWFSSVSVFLEHSLLQSVSALDDFWRVLCGSSFGFSSAKKVKCANVVHKPTAAYGYVTSLVLTEPLSSGLWFCQCHLIHAVTSSDSSYWVRSTVLRFMKQFTDFAFNWLWSFRSGKRACVYALDTVVLKDSLTGELQQGLWH